MISFLNQYHRYDDLPETYQQMIRCMYFYCAENVNKVLPVCFCPKQEITILQKDIRFLNEIGFDYQTASINSLKQLLETIVLLIIDQTNGKTFHVNGADVRWIIERMIDIKRVGFEYDNRFIGIESFFPLFLIGVRRIFSRNEMSSNDKADNGVERLISANDINEIVLFSQKTFTALSDSVISVAAYIQCSKSTTPVLINLYFDVEKNIYYMNSESYRLYAERYGLMPYHIRLACSYEVEQTGLNEESELFLCGYSVSKEKGLSDRQRQELLKQIIDLRILKKAAIINHIEYLIHFSQNQRKKEDAIEKWKRDLRFINDYNLSAQPTIYGTITNGTD